MIRIRYGREPVLKGGGGVSLSAPSVAAGGGPGSETKFVGTATDDASFGNEPWSNPGNVTADDGAVAVCDPLGSTSHYLKATMAGNVFTVPSGATIDGIVVVIERRADSLDAILDDVVRLVKGGVVSGDNKASATAWPVAFTTRTYGGAADLWGLTLTPADVNAANFGVALAISDSQGAQASVDYISITVHYTA